jgi:hypothetical protein
MLTTPTILDSICVLQVSGSPQIIRDLMSGVFPLIPDLDLVAVDVRDVARAHIMAMIRPVSGRFVLVENNYSFRRVCEICRANGYSQVCKQVLYTSHEDVDSTLGLLVIAAF